jgi:hypothetical protein
MRTFLLRTLPVALLFSLVSCTETEITTPTTTTTTGSEQLHIPDDPDCDPLVPEVCAMPYPSSRWLAPDPARVTGYTLTFGPTTLPATKGGIHIDPAPYARFDGYGLGVPAVTYFPDLDGSDLPDETHIPESLTDEARVMMFEVDGGVLKRVPCFAEIDQTAKLDEERSLIIRPAVLLKEATRYVVALRGLKRTDGADVPPSDAFRALRDGIAAGTPVEGRVPLYDELFGLLADAGVPRADLQLTWDWVTASDEALHGPLLHMRDEAFAELGDASPVFAVTSIETYTEDQNPDIAYEVLGTFEVPDYTVTTPIGAKEGHILNWGPDGLPVQSGVYKAEFRARVPRSALTGEPHGVIVHGHGLNGTHGQIRNGTFDALAQQEKVVIVGCNMIGMSGEDVDTILEMLNDMSGFPALADRLHQGALDHAFLARGMKTGFDKIPEIAATGLVIDPEALYYNGISQGGIFGATHMALSLDFKRGHLGVPGNNYSTLLQRSVDFNPFFVLLGFVYPDARDQQILLGTIQNLWDRTDPVSHYRHISAEPYPGTPPHEVLLASATADWQVALLTNEIAARSDVGVALLPGYGRDVSLVEPVTYPHKGSGLVNYSFGNPWPPPGNKPPFDDIGDPHGEPRKLAWHNAQMMHFFRTGEILDVCGGDGCTPD